MTGDGGHRGGAGGGRGAVVMAEAQNCSDLPVFAAREAGPRAGPQARCEDQGAGTRASVPSPRLMAPRAFPLQLLPQNTEARGELRKAQ